MVVHAYYPRGETRVQREAEALVEAGFSVDVICPRRHDEPARERYRGVEIHRLPVRIDKGSLGRQFLAYLRFFAHATLRLTRLHLRHPYASVQVHNLPDFLVFCALVPKAQGVPVILDLHDLMPEFFAARFGSDRRTLRRLVGWQERLACRFADHVITVSEQWRRSLVRRGVPKERCSVVMNLADERIFAPLPQHRPSGTGLHLVYHGTVTRRYGLDLAIRAVGLVRKEIPGIRLTILGRGDDVQALMELRRELGLEDVVDLRDEFLPAEDLPPIIAEADVGLAPYRNDPFTDELLPTKLMEYAVMQLPCIASRTTAIEAYFGDAMVQFFRPGDADDLARCIRELNADPARRAELAARSANFTQRYDWERVGAAYVELVRGLSLSGSNRTPARPARG